MLALWLAGLGLATARYCGNGFAIYQIVNERDGAAEPARSFKHLYTENVSVVWGGILEIFGDF